MKNSNEQLNTIVGEIGSQLRLVSVELGQLKTAIKDNLEKINTAVDASKVEFDAKTKATDIRVLRAESEIA